MRRRQMFAMLTQQQEVKKHEAEKAHEAGKGRQEVLSLRKVCPMCGKRHKGRCQ